MALVMDGEQLKMALRANGHNEAWLAGNFNMREATVCSWIAGKSVPSFTVGVETARLLGISPDALVREAPDDATGEPEAA